MNIRKLAIAIAVTAAGIAFTPTAEAGRHSGRGFSPSAGHARSSFSRGPSLSRGRGPSSFRSAGVTHRSYNGSGINRNVSRVRNPLIGPQNQTFGGRTLANGGPRNTPTVSNHRAIGTRTVAIANGNGRYRTGIGSHNTWGGRHHGPDHHSRHHHHDYGFAGLGLFGYPYGYGYGYGSGYRYSSYGYGNGYNSDISVADIQQALAEQGYYRGEIDGVFGYNTAQAIRAFQANNGLPVSGRLDAPLVRALGF